jgi:hypothetical protein
MEETFKPKWQRNNAGGYSLMMWAPDNPIMLHGQVAYTRPGYWRGVADVFKAKKGNRWVARWLAHEGLHINWRQGSTLTLREAMRLAQFMAGLHHV